MTNVNTPGPVTWAAVPASSSAAGTPGMVARDTVYIYICVALNTWKRITLEAY